jgi:hypothetical protein
MEYNGLEIQEGYFSPAMECLRNKFLNVPVDTVLHSASPSAQVVAGEQKARAAEVALAAQQAREHTKRRSAASALWPPSRPTLLVGFLVGVAVLGAITMQLFMAKRSEVAAPTSARPTSAPLPQFPWPPPAASATYVLPDNLLQGRRTVGEVVASLISALESNGYVERSFFQTEALGVALVTQLERINDDGSSVVGSERWPVTARPTYDLIRFLRGLFFVDRGHYRLIVFIIQNLPFSQSARTISQEEARTWLMSGFNILPPSIGKRPFIPDGHCTVLVYEFASDGTMVHVVPSGLTGKQHLEKAGVLSLLGNAN